MQSLRREGLVRLCAFLALSMCACSESGDDHGGSSSGGIGAGTSLSGGSGNDGSGGSSGAGVGAAGDGGSPGGDRYAVGVWTTDPSGAWVGNALVVADLTDSTTIDLAQAIPFQDDMVYATPGDGKVYVGRGGEPVVERYALDQKDELVLEERMGLAQYGIASGMGTKDPIHFISKSKAYFIDQDSLQVVIFDPGTMSSEGVFSIEGFEHDDYPWFGLNFVHRDGDRLLLSARYWRADDTAAPLTRLAIIDTTQDTVRFVDDTRCGNVAFQAHDSENNLYLATHTYQTGAIAVGAAGDPAAESCIIRILSGADDFDGSYYVNLDELAGRSAGGIMQGPGDEAFVLVHAGEPLTLDTFADAQKRTEWEVYRITLGDEAATFSKVDGIGLQSGYGLAFSTVVEGEQVPFVVSVKDDFSAGAYWNATNSDTLEQWLSLPGWPGSALKLR